MHLSCKNKNRNPKMQITHFKLTPTVYKNKRVTVPSQLVTQLWN